MTAPSDSGFRTGLVALLGRTNVGKSTLLNALVQEKIAIVTPKPQTTRHPVQGVVHRPDGQIVFVDTPGFHQTHRSDRVDRLHARARTALEGIDAVVHVVDPSRPPGREDEMVLQTLASIPQPVLLCLNKSDLRHRPHRAAWLGRPGYQAVVEVSALAGRNLEALVQAILPCLPVGPPLYPPDQTTNASRDFRIAETIREKVYDLMNDEVPYRTAVRVDECVLGEGESGTRQARIHATILVAQDRYKAMVIGARGAAVRNIQAAARVDLRRLLGCRVSLKLEVHVDATSPD